MYNRLGVIIIVVVALLAGVYIRGVLAENTYLKQEVQAQEALTASLRASIDRTEAAYLKAQKTAQRASTEATEARRKLSEANDDASTKWRTGRIPEPVLDSLR